MPRKNPLPKVEREVGHRVRQIRRAAKCPRSYLAFLTGVTHSAIASLEIGRTAAKFDFAAKFCARFNINPTWLATGKGELHPCVKLPTTEQIGVSKDSRFIEVFSRLSAKLAGGAEAESVDDPEQSEQNFRRQDMVDLLFAELLEKTEEIRDDVLDAFLIEVSLRARDAMKPSWIDRGEAIFKRRQERATIASLRRSNPDSDGQPDFANTPPDSKHLTNTETSPKSHAVKSQLPGLLERLRKVAAGPGKKTALADWLNPKVPLASVSRWLSGEREPGGEVTLQLLKWVELQERQAK